MVRAKCVRCPSGVVDGLHGKRKWPLLMVTILSTPMSSLLHISSSLDTSVTTQPMESLDNLFNLDLSMDTYPISPTKACSSILSMATQASSMRPQRFLGKRESRLLSLVVERFYGGMVGDRFLSLVGEWFWGMAVERFQLFCFLENH